MSIDWTQIVIALVSVVVGWIARHQGISPIPLPKPNGTPPASAHPLLQELLKKLETDFLNWANGGQAPKQ
jgi:hypothetical protein